MATSGVYREDMESRRGRLIQVVREREALWHSRSANRHVKAAKWREVADMLEMELNDVQAEWRYLRNYYARLRRTVDRRMASLRAGGREAGEAEEGAESSWVHYRSLEFLAPHLREDRELRASPYARPQNSHQQGLDWLQNMNCGGEAGDMEDSKAGVEASAWRVEEPDGVSASPSVSTDAEVHPASSGLPVLNGGLPAHSAWTPRAAGPRPPSPCTAFGTLVSSVLRELTVEQRRAKMRQLNAVLFAE